MKRNPTTIVVGAFLLLIFILLLFLFQVRNTEFGVVTTFGRVTSSAGPGAHFRWPWPIQSVYKFDQRIHNYETKFEQVFTSDGHSLLIMVYVGWRISDPAIYLTRFNDDARKAEDSLGGLIRNAYSGVVGRHRFSHFVSTDEKELKFVEIEKDMQSRIQADCRSLTNGLDIAFLGIKRLGLPESVTKLVFERMASEREVKVSEIKSDGESQASVIRTKANATAVRTLAEADATATRIQGEAENEAARSFRVFNQEPALATFLYSIKSLQEFLQGPTTLILDANSAPWDLVKGQPEEKKEKK